MEPLRVGGAWFLYAYMHNLNIENAYGHILVIGPLLIGPEVVLFERLGRAGLGKNGCHAIERDANHRTVGCRFLKHGANIDALPYERTNASAAFGS